jgi:hypothetical protein
VQNILYSLKKPENTPANPDTPRRGVQNVAISRIADTARPAWTTAPRRHGFGQRTVDCNPAPSGGGDGDSRMANRTPAIHSGISGECSIHCRSRMTRLIIRPRGRILTSSIGGD